MLIRKEIYSIEEVLSKRLPSGMGKTKETIVLFDGDPAYMSSQRYEVFDKKGVACVTCGLKGNYFAKEKHVSKIKGKTESKTWHFNLYALNDDKEEVMMTKDHIIAKSKGGKNNISNYQPMCAECNQLKADN